jgi:hypothetical protein
VEAAGQCKEPVCILSFRLPEPVPVRDTESSDVPD